MIFGTILEVSLDVERRPGDEMIYGAWVALESFYKGLLTYGTFDEYHFFVDSPSTAHRFKENLESLNINTDKIRLVNIKKLPAYLHQTKYTVFLTDGISDFSEITYLRNRYAKTLFPICTLTYSISYPEMIKNEFFGTLISDTYPFDSTICISTAQLKALKKLYRLTSGYTKKGFGLNLKYKGRFDLLPLAINAPEYRKTNKCMAKKLLGLPQNKIIILYFGRFSSFDKADLHPLLLVFKKLSQQRDDILLVLAGKDAQGGYGRQVKKITKESDLFSKVRFFLNPSLNKKYLLYSGSDIFISPSDNIQESFGLTILEAMAFGLGIVASDWDGYKDIVVHKKTGFLVPTYWADCNDEMAYLSRTNTSSRHDHFYLAQSVCVDNEKMGEYLLNLIEDKNLRLKMGDNARQRVLTNYDWKVLVPEYEKLWKKLSNLSKDFVKNRCKKKPLAPDYFKCFCHYPTRMLNARAKIAISKNGIGFLKTKKTLSCPRSLHKVLSMSIIFAILISLAEQPASTMGRIEEETKRVFKNMSSDNIRYHIMWLLKKGMVKIK